MNLTPETPRDLLKQLQIGVRNPLKRCCSNENRAEEFALADFFVLSRGFMNINK
jgi:hypothetical protein